MSLEELRIPLEEQTEKRVKQLLKGFFEFYIAFNYDNVICPYLGKAIKASEIEKHMPPRLVITKLISFTFY